MVSVVACLLNKNPQSFMINFEGLLFLTPTDYKNSKKSVKVCCFFKKITSNTIIINVLRYKSIETPNL